MTFLVDTSDGQLSFFWRGSIGQLKGPKGLELKFLVEVRRPNVDITAVLACEDIVGTMVTKTVDHKLPRAAFRERDIPPTPSSESQTREWSISETLIGLEDDVDDETMLLALAEATAALPGPSLPTPPDSGIVGPENIEEPDLLGPDVGRQAATVNAAIVVPEPVRLANGRYVCNHSCAQGALTKTGRQCTHKCCHDGLDKPRRRKAPNAEREKRKAAPGK